MGGCLIHGVVATKQPSTDGWAKSVVHVHRDKFGASKSAMYYISDSSVVIVLNSIAIINT